MENGGSFTVKTIDKIEKTINMKNMKYIIKVPTPSEFGWIADSYYAEDEFSTAKKLFVALEHAQMFIASDATRESTLIAKK
jgi:hypothetical protein